MHRPVGTGPTRKHHAVENRPHPVHGKSHAAVPDKDASCRAGSYRPPVTNPNAKQTSESQRPVGTGPTRKHHAVENRPHPVHGKSHVAVPDKDASCRAGSYRPPATNLNAEQAIESQRPVGTGPTRKHHAVENRPFPAHDTPNVAVPDKAAFCRAGSHRPPVTNPNAEQTSESQRPVGTGPTRRLFFRWR